MVGAVAPCLCYVARSNHPANDPSHWATGTPGTRKEMVMVDPGSADPNKWPHEMFMAEIGRRHHEAFVQAGFAKNGKIDTLALDEAIFPHVRSHVVPDKMERATGALLKPVLVRELFPGIVQLGETGWESMNTLERAVSHDIGRSVWDRIKPVGGRIQRWLGGENDPLLMCKCRVSPDGKGAVEAVYCTKDLELIKLDYAGPYQDRLRSQTARYSEAMGEAIRRRPEHQKELEKQVTTTMDAVGQLARSMLAIESGESDS